MLNKPVKFIITGAILLLLACKDNPKVEPLFDAMESKGLTDTIVGEEYATLLNELKGIRKGILQEDSIKQTYVTSKGRIYDPMVLYTEEYNERLTIEIANDYLRIRYHGTSLPKIFYKEMWVFRCKSDKDTITYDPKTISATNPPKCRDGKILNGKTYKKSIEAVRLWPYKNSIDVDVMQLWYSDKEREEDLGEIEPMSSAYDELGKMITYIREHAFYKDADIVGIIGPPDGYVFDEIFVDKFIKVLKLARDARYNRHNIGVDENEDFNYEHVKWYKITKSISGVQFYPTIYLGKKHLF